MKTAFIILIFLLSAFALSAFIINIPDDYITIQEGIDTSVDSDTVLVQPGSYVENINYNGKNITVGSLFLTTADTTYISQTIIDGNQNGFVVNFNNEEDSTAVLSGFTITNGSGYTGGGIYCYESNPSIENVTISGNSATWRGGGIYFHYSNPSLENVTIMGNSADHGGGIYCDESNLSLVNVNITSNSAGCSDFSATGGGIYIEYSNMDLVNVTISGNSADDNGGGIYCKNSILNFSSDSRCNVFSNTIDNTRGFGADLFATECDIIDVIVDTFTVMTPTDFYASQIDNFTFDINSCVMDNLINEDVYVSVEGDNINSGISPDFPFKTIKYALSRIYSDSLNINTIHLAPGVYSNSTNGEVFPLYWSNYVNLSGISQENTILDADSTSGGLCFNNVTEATINDITITNSTFGGIVCSNNSSPSLIDITLTDNSYSGIHMHNSNPSLENVTISGNSSSFGGGIECRYYSSPRLVNTLIANNSATYCGGGIYFDIGCNMSLVNVTIANNSANSNGGGIFCSLSSLSLINVTISGNSTNNNGGGIYCSSSNLSLLNCISWNDSPQEFYFNEDYDPNSITISYSDIQGGEDGIVTNNNGTVYWEEGNIDAEPLFAGAGDHPYALLEDSPCIDAGIPDTTGLNLPPWDILCNERIWDGDADGFAVIDMGAYEYGAPPYTDVDEPVISNFPFQISNLKNYPNPFNPTTTISFQMSGVRGQEDVELVIYNIKGQKIKVLDTFLNGSLGTSGYSVTWNGRDDHNQPVSAGVYFYKLKAGNVEKIKKMVLLK